MQGPVDAYFAPRILTPEEREDVKRRTRENPYTVSRAAGRIALATADMQSGKMVGALDLRAFSPTQLQQTLDTTCFFRGVMNLAMAFGYFPQNPYIMATRERLIAQEATEVGLLGIFGADTQRQTPTRMEDFLQLYTHLTVSSSHPTARFPDTQLVAALREGNAALALVYRDDLGRQEWEAFYGIEKTQDDVLFYSAFSGTGQTMVRTGHEMAQALFGTIASLEVWIVEVPTPYSPPRELSTK